MSDWNPEQYARFTDLRLRPALDLLNAVGELPQGEIRDLGCGAGAVAPLLRARFPERVLIGVEQSEAMRAKARALSLYTEVQGGDIARHDLGEGNALLFTNAALNWLPDHKTLLPRLIERLVPGGWLATQVPYQHDAPSHALARQVAHDLAPKAFPETRAKPHVRAPRTYAALLAPLGEVRVWMTEYMQNLPPAAEGHPVRQFTRSTYLRPYLAHFEAEGREAEYLAAYDAALGEAYPLEEGGGVWFPFKRLFLTLRKT
ncbi:methyltransferase domain-containing protein [Celeribacter neptunius]|uniref:Trans-aconitate 2-methyltransferase n=1 Tax=Celeribacter neptunius TaxID=588602 RepID=A0A1I3TN96_9RHOB|nr:methyltransferase domain-containing protein [Celeribacter neptunius]SFJ71953.1 trans-aconitate 2-methyltransferase [Celeribacter neptunius]